VLARLQVLRPAARAPAAAWIRVARGACTVAWATAEGRSAAGLSSGQEGGQHEVGRREVLALEQDRPGSA
jgi:hypothetical protein